MKNLFFYSLALILVLGACKKEEPKDNPPSPEPDYCYQKTYYDTIPNSIESAYVTCFTEDEENNFIFVLCDNSTNPAQYFITKLDSVLNEDWTIPINVFGRVIDLTHDSENNYYVISQLRSQEETGSSYFEDVFFMYQYNFIDCYPVYQVIDIDLISYEDHSKTQVQKYSNTGNLLWTKEYKGSAPENRNILAILETNEAVLATYDFPNLNYELVFRDGVFQDTVNIAESTYLHIHKISPSGTIVWDKDILIPTLYYDGWLEYGQYGTSLYVTYSGSEIIITAFNTVYILNEYGEIIDDYRISSENCIDLFNCSSPNISDEMVMLCSYPAENQYIQWPQYLARYQTSNELNWIADMEYGTDPNILLFDDGEFIYQTGHIITKYNQSGTILWQHQYPQYSMPAVKANCLSGYSVVKSISSGDQSMLVITRTDENGHY